MMRKRFVPLILLIALVVLALSPPQAHAEILNNDDAFLHSRPVVSPGFYHLWGRGNCVWFSWECAWQALGVRLPWAGDAKNWIRLAGCKVLSDDGKAYRLELKDTPEKDSFMIFQPELCAGPYAGCGHVACVVRSTEAVFTDSNGREWRPGLWNVFVLESTVYPPKNWGDAELAGCRYRKHLYIYSRNVKGIDFLTFKEVA